MIIIADVVFSTEAIVVISALLGALCLAIGVVFRLFVASYQERITDLVSQRSSYREIAHEATVALETKVNQVRKEKGEPPTTIVAPVVPEHNSPTTPKQQDNADLQTMRARLVAATLALDLPVREASAPARPEDPPKR